MVGERAAALLPCRALVRGGALRHEPLADARDPDPLAPRARRGSVGARPAEHAYSFFVSSYPDVRLRRLRRSRPLRALVRETRLSLDPFVMPPFRAPEALRHEALPGRSRHTVDCRA